MEREMTKTGKWGFVLALLALLSPGAMGVDYYVDGFAGSDVNGTGTQDNPWQTITYALNFTTSGDTIYASSAIYDQSIGEEFPIHMQEGVNIIGADPVGAVISRDPTGPSTGNDVVRINNNCTLAGFTLKGADPEDWWCGLVVGWFTGTDFTLHDCILTGDRRAILMFNSGSPQDNLHIYQCLISKATSDSIALWDVTGLKIINNTIDGGSVARSGIVVENCEGDIENNIIVNHVWSGIEFGPGNALKIECNNVWNNNMDYRNGSAPPNNISKNPRFVASAQGDYHLRLFSPCVDSGNDEAYGLPETDIEGDPRIVNGDWVEGDHVDMGCEELIPEVAARFGNVNAGAGWVANVLRVNHSGGDHHRVFETRVKSALQIDIFTPPGGPSPSDFVLYIFPYEPKKSHITLQPFGIGRTAFPTILSGGKPRPVTVANTVGYLHSLGKPLLPWVPPAPAVILNLWAGLPAPGVCCLQGFIVDNASNGPSFSVTNGILLRVNP